MDVSDRMLCKYKNSYDVFYNKNGCEFRVYNFFDQYGKNRKVRTDDFRIEWNPRTLNIIMTSSSTRRPEDPTL